MSQYVINIGALPNDGTGDPLRTAFNDVNLNFNQVFAAGPVLSNIQIANNTILTLNTNGNLVLNPNGIGVVQANAHVVPDSTRIRNLGSSSKLWNTVYTQNINVAGTATIANVSISGGNITIPVADLHILGGTNGYVLQTDGTGNLTWTAQTGGSGNATPAGANTQVQYNNAGTFGGAAGFTFDNTANALAIAGTISALGNVTSGNVSTAGVVSAGGNVRGANFNTVGVVTATGNITGNYFIGNGSQLTGIVSSYGNSNVATYLPTYSGNISAGNVGVSGAVNAVGEITSFANIVTTGEVQATGNVVGDYFIGNGSQLTGLPEQYGNANVVALLSDFGSNTISTTGNISSGNIIVNGSGGDISGTGNITAAYFIGNGSQLTDVASTGNLEITGTLIEIAAGAPETLIDISPSGPTGGWAFLQLPDNDTANTANTRLHNAAGNVEFGTGDFSTGSTDYIWTLDNTGNLNLPANGDINFNGGSIAQTLNEDFYIRASDDEADGWSIYNVIDDGAGNPLSQTRLEFDQYTIRTDAQGASYTWAFRDTGVLELPGDIYGNVGGNLTIKIVDQAGSDTFIDLQTRSHAGDALISNIRIANPDVTISTAGAVYNWTFDGTGNLTVPGNIQSISTGFPFSSGIIGIDNTSPAVITVADSVFPDPVTGRVTISGVNPPVQANGTWYYEAVETNQFALYLDAELTQPVDATGWPGYVDGGLAVSPGYSNVAITGGNVSIVTNTGNTWTFGDDGNLLVPQGGYIGPAGVKGDGTMLTGGKGNIASLTSYYSNVDALNYSSCVTVNPDGTLNITTYGDGTGQLGQWVFTDINLNVPGNSIISTPDAVSGAGGNSISIVAGASDPDNLNSNSGGNLNLIGGYGSFGDGGGGPGGNVNIQSGFSEDSHPGNVNVNTGGGYIWTLDYTGNLTLPQGGVVYETNIPFGGLEGKTIALKPYGGTDADQQLLVYPTAGADFNHLHLTTGNLWNTEMFLGNDDFYVKLANTGNVVINTNDNGGNTYQLNFTPFGEMRTTGSLFIQTPNGVPNSVTAITGSSGSWESNPVTDLPTTDGTGAGLTVNVTQDGGYASAIAIVNPGSGYANGDVITVTSGSSSATFTISVANNQWILDTEGELTLPTISLGSGLNEQTVISSQRKLIPPFRWSAVIDGVTPTVVYTATDVNTTSMKVTVQIQHSGLGMEFFEVFATFTGADTYYTVSNRVAPPTIDASTVVVDLNGSNEMQITVTINSGATTSWVTYDAVEFGIPQD